MENMGIGTPSRLAIWKFRRTFAPMYITKARKYEKDADGKFVAYDYYRLTRKRYDQWGKEKVTHFCLGRLEGLTRRETRRAGRHADGDD